MPKIVSIASADKWWVISGNRVGDNTNNQRERIAAWGLLDDGSVVPLTPIPGGDRLVALDRRTGDVWLWHENGPEFPGLSTPS